MKKDNGKNVNDSTVKTDCEDIECEQKLLTIKLLEFVKSKKTLTDDELLIFLMEHNNKRYYDEIEHTLAILETNNIQLMGEGFISEEDGRYICNNNTLDYYGLLYDPIMIYLREIGKEALLASGEEVELFRQIEEGENIIKDTINNTQIYSEEIQKLSDNIIQAAETIESLRKNIGLHENYIE
jgi:RNA polymerase primary sigma factor